MVGGGWVCKPILVISFAGDKPQADQQLKKSKMEFYTEDPSLEMESVKHERGIFESAQVTWSPLKGFVY